MSALGFVNKVIVADKTTQVDIESNQVKIQDSANPRRRRLRPGYEVWYLWMFLFWWYRLYPTTYYEYY